MTGISDFTIIGGGINGLLTARELVLAGASVTLFDKSCSGRESSWAGGGILLPLYPWRQCTSISRLVMQSLKLYPALAQQLHANTGIDPELESCGLLITHIPDLEAALAWCTQNQMPSSACSQQQLVDFNTKTENPLWLPHISQARNPRLLKALKGDLLARNVVFIENTELQGITISQNHINKIKTSKGNFDTNHLILATGAWSGNLWQSCLTNTSLHLPLIYPVKGQMVLLEGEPGLLRHMILAENSYLIPRRDGKILVGSTVEHQGFDKRVTQEAKNRLSAFATHFFPALANLPIINHWAGIRPGTDRGIPYIDQHPKIKNLSINAGHFRNGLAMGPASAELLVDLICKRTPKVEPAPYLLSARH